MATAAAPHPTLSVPRCGEFLSRDRETFSTPSRDISPQFPQISCKNGAMEGVTGTSSRWMLLSFRGRNVRSFRDEFELSLVASTVAEKESVRDVPWREGGATVGVLPAAGIFGANGSGKSNLLRAINDMRALILSSFTHARPKARINRRPFMLSPSGREEPSKFEVDLIVDGIRHEYGFLVDDQRVIEEWAYRYPHGRSTLLFRRHLDSLDLSRADRGKGRAVSTLLRPNALFLSTAAAAEHPTLLPIYQWFERNLWLAEADSRPGRQAVTAKMLVDPSSRERVLALLRAADLGITDVKQEALDPEFEEKLRKVLEILRGDEADGSAADAQFGMINRLVHKGRDSDVDLDPTDESLGTMVWMGLIGPVVQSLSDGTVFLADELDASLHPSLVAQLVGLFQRKESNPHGAQLVFNSHDATLLGDSTAALLGRDQIWFTEKVRDGSTRLYPLVDLAPRREEAVGRRYLAGRYGATPILSRQEFDAAAELITTPNRE